MSASDLCEQRERLTDILDIGTRVAEEHLNDCVNKTGEQTPLRAVAVSGENDRQHAADGESAAEREIQERDEAAHDIEHGCDSDKQRALNKNFCVAFLGC